LLDDEGERVAAGSDGHREENFRVARLVSSVSADFFDLGAEARRAWYEDQEQQKGA